jgi:hypothetical protein
MPTHNRSKLTPEFCRKHRLLFYPRTTEDAVFIQERLADFGIHWVGGAGPGSHARECVDKGMLVDGGELYYNPQAKSDDILCDATQFDKNFLPPDRAFLLEQFNKLAEKIDAQSARIAELEKKVGEMQDALFPKVEDTKPSLKHKP